jgi:hypothetical protein
MGVRGRGRGSVRMGMRLRVRVVRMGLRLRIRMRMSLLLRGLWRGDSADNGGKEEHGEGRDGGRNLHRRRSMGI